MEFVNLHNHSEFSLLDGMISPEEMINFAKENDQKAIAITDHGKIGGFFKLLKHGKEKGIKPLIGVEVYMVKDINFQQNRSKGEKEQRYHLTLIAKNKKGMQDLFELTSKSHTEGFYYRPRVNMEWLNEFSDNLIVMSGCIAGVIPQLILDGKYSLAKEQAERLNNYFNDFYMEMQPNSLGEQKKVNRGLMKIHNETGIPLVATTDAHYLKEQQESHKVLLGINSGGDMWEFNDDTFYLMTGSEMFELMKKNHPFLPEKLIRGAIKNTIEIADKCDWIENERLSDTLPNPYPELKDKEEEFEFLKELCEKGWEEKNMMDKKDLPEYQERLDRELTQIKKLGFVRYFLLVHDLYENFVKPNDLMYGTGRGSSAGSLVCCLLDITTPDPIEYGLMFERFISPNRVHEPDVDMDFEDKRREEVKEYFIEKYGREYVADIGTYGTMKGKQVLRDVSRVFDIPKKEVDKVSNFIIQRSGGDARASNTMEDTFKEFDECKKFDARHPEVLKHAKNLEGRVRHAGTHAAGVIVSNVKLNRHTPLEVRGGQNGNITTALDWRETDKQGFLKMDLLGLKTLSIIKDTIDQVKLTKEDFDKYNIDLDFPKDEEEITMKRKHLVHVDYNDERVLDEFRAGDTEGVFQFNSVGMSDILKDMKVKGFKDLVALNALYRPGGMRSGIARDYIERRNGEQEIEKVNPIYDKITEETQGLIVFQEQVMKIFSDMANRNAIEVNKMREKVAKSHGMQSMQEEKKGFIEGCVENDIDKEFAEELFQKIAHFGSYAFNKCVSGKTILNIERKEGLDRQVNIENLYDRYEGKNIPKGEIKVRSYKSDDGFRSIKRVYKTGIKEVYRLGLTLGNFIYATKDHKFLTDLGWKRLGNLSMNDFIYVWDNNCNRNKYKLSGIESIKEVGEEMTYDLEVYSNNEIGHNYIANGIVTHNSHAIVYTQIAYWTQWLKTFYPLEFYVASLNNESDDDKVRRLLGALEKKGYRLLLPHVNKSKEGFRVEEWDGEKAIRFGLRYIKGIGETTAEEIVKHQPYEDEEDIKTRKGIKRRTFHKGIRRLLREVDAWVDDDSYSQEELEGLREFLAAEELLPLPVLGKNIKKAREMAKNYDVNLTDVKDIDFSHNDFVYLCGVFNGANYARIGDFGKPSKYSKWEVGDRYVMMDLQDGTAHMRIKFNPKKYQEYKDKLRIGQKVLIHGRIIKDIKMVFIDFMVVLSEEKIKEHKEKYGEE